MQELLLALLISGSLSSEPQLPGQHAFEPASLLYDDDQESQKKPILSRGGRPDSSAALAEEVRHELVMLPYYNVFDWLEGEVRGENVVLRGQVTRPITKSDAIARVKDLEGVERVVDEIEVLPVSPNDDRLRRALYRSIFSFNSPLFRYAIQSVPPIHIIVKGGRATLKGIVANDFDRQVAYTKARTVPGLFEVKNELRVER